MRTGKTKLVTQCEVPLLTLLLQASVFLGNPKGGRCSFAFCAGMFYADITVKVFSQRFIPSSSPKSVL
jgi:hypothetical protein